MNNEHTDTQYFLNEYTKTSSPTHPLGDDDEAFLLFLIITSISYLCDTKILLIFTANNHN